MSHVIAFANNKGGVGKSTSVSSVGSALAQMGKKVLFVDLDSQANLTSMVSPTPVGEHLDTIMDTFEGDTESLPVEVISENISIVPSSLRLSKFDTATAGDSLRVYMLKDQLSKLEDQYDYILIDCPPALGTITTMAMVAANHLVLVTTADKLSYDGMTMVGGVLNHVRRNERLNPNCSLLGVIITKYRSNKIANAYVRKITGETGDLFLHPLIHEEAAVLKAVSLDKSLLEFAPSSKAAKAYTEITEEIVRRLEPRK